MDRPHTDRLISTSMILENKLKSISNAGTGIKTARQIKN
jgi:hypothetical protein